MFSDVTRRHSRRRRLLWTAALAVAALLAVTLGSLGERARTSSVTLEDLRDETVRLERDAGTFQDLLLRMPAVERSEFEGVIEELQASLAESETFLSELPPDLPYAGQAVAARLAVDVWRGGLEAFRTQVLAAADDPFAVTATDGVIDALLDLRAGDRLYAEFVAAMAEPDLPQPVSPFPEVRFLPDGFPIITAATSYTENAKDPESPLQLRAELALGQITTDPEWLLDADDNLVVIATDTLTVDVVVENRGNIPAEPQTVFLDLFSGGELIDTRSVEVDALGPGEKTVASFIDLPVQPGVAYAVSVRVGVVDLEDQTDDNSRIVEFRVNAETETTSTTPHVDDGDGG